MKTKYTILFLGILFIFLAGSIWWKLSDYRENQNNVQQAKQTVTLDPNAKELTQEQVETAEAVMKVFANNIATAINEKDTEAAEAVKNTLSERGRNVVEIDQDIINGLIRFLRVDIPQEVTVKSTTKKNESFAEAVTNWKYADKTEEYYIYLVVENNRWRVDSVQTVKQ